MGRPRKSAEQLAEEKQIKEAQAVAKVERTQERAASLIDQERSMQKQAANLTSDLRKVYGVRSMSLFGGMK